MSDSDLLNIKVLPQREGLFRTVNSGILTDDPGTALASGILNLAEIALDRGMAHFLLQKTLKAINTKEIKVTEIAK